MREGEILVRSPPNSPVLLFSYLAGGLQIQLIFPLKISLLRHPSAEQVDPSPPNIPKPSPLPPKEKVQESALPRVRKEKEVTSWLCVV